MFFCILSNKSKAAYFKYECNQAKIPVKSLSAKEAPNSYLKPTKKAIA